MGWPTTRTDIFEEQKSRKRIDPKRETGMEQLETFLVFECSIDRKHLSYYIIYVGFVVDILCIPLIISGITQHN